MNVKAILIGLAALVVIGGGAFFIVNNQNDKTDNSQNSQTQSADQASKENTSLKGLLAQNKNLKCTFNSSDDSGNSTAGTVYISGKKMRGNFNLKTAGQAEQKSNLLRDDSYQYVWNEGDKTGFKVSVSSISSSGDQNQQSQQDQQSVDQDKNYEFDCTSWTVDQAMFKAPGDVQFTDYSAQVQQSQQLQQNASGACAQIADASARAACEQAL